MIEVLYSVHHGYEPFSTSHPEINLISNGPLLETVSHVPNILLFDFVEVVKAVEACFGADGCPLVRDAEADPFETLVDYNIRVDNSCHVVDTVSYL